MRVALRIKSEAGVLNITKAIRSEEDLNQAINFFRGCKAEVDGEEIETELCVMPDKIRLVNFLNWEKTE